MDIVTLALARKYVNTKIAGMGTLQKLQGRVNTYNDLLKITNPQPGDTYVVGTPNEENSEYMYVGDEWEKLGPLVDITSLTNAIEGRPTYNETEEMINEAITETLEPVDAALDAIIYGEGV